jgi:hypothetical protein
MRKKKCKGCIRKFIPVSKKQLFHSHKCNTRYHSLKRYYRLRENPEFKKKRKNNFRKWINKNRNHFNDLCRERNKINQRRLRKERIKKGLCYCCGGEREDKAYKSCEKCRIYWKFYKEGRK